MPCPLISRRLKLATGEISTVGRPTSEGRQFVAAKEATVAKDLFTVWGPSCGASPGPAPLGQVLTLWAKCEAAMGCLYGVIFVKGVPRGAYPFISTPVSLFDLASRFFVPTHDRIEPARRSEEHTS